MKKFLVLAIVTGIMNSANAQLMKKVLDKTKQKTEDKVSEKISDKVSDAASKPIDDASKPNKNKEKNKDENKDQVAGKNTETNKVKTDDNIKGSASTATLSTYSKFDFIPGERILVFEDFSQDAIGDYPAKWNTNSSGEVVTAGGQEGHWLMVSKKGRFIPDYITSLPENFTFQFDLLCNEKFNFYSNPLQIFFVTGKNGKEALDNSFIQWEKRSGIKLAIHPANAGSTGGVANIQSFENGETVINNEVNTTQFNSNNGKTKVKVSVWRQNQRVRVYLNEEKVFDLPRAFLAGKDYSTVLFEIWSGMNNDVDRYLFSNIKLAVGAPDTRNKLITEGKFVTRGILFDVNSDKIKPESYGVLKDISNVLSENSGVKVLIVGHTDADGKDDENLALSKRRAESVKIFLVSEFKIDAARIQTDGKGESQPVDKNNTPEGKANNRRVEFIKQL